MAFISLVDPERADDETREAWSEVCRVRHRPPPRNLYRSLAHNPAVMLAWSGLAQTLRGFDRDGTLVPGLMLVDRRTRELAILAVCTATRCDYEWALHVRSATSIGISHHDIDALRRGELSSFGEAERAAISYATELTSLGVTEGTRRDLRRHFSDREIFELTTVVGFYNCVARVVSGLSIDPAGE